jgi:hypothetical protein
MRLCKQNVGSLPVPAFLRRAQKAFANAAHAIGAHKTRADVFECDDGSADLLGP